MSSKRGVRETIPPWIRGISAMKDEKKPELTTRTWSPGSTRLAIAASIAEKDELANVRV
nr:hypothetical protein [Candidatus Freyrarchaeum guaymaensis]